MEHTLRSMKSFQVGLKPPGIWTNRTPPIRGGCFDKTALLDNEWEIRPSIGFASRKQSPACSDDSAYVSGRELTPDQAVQQTANAPYALPITKEKLLSHDVPDSQIIMNPDEWTEWAIRQGQEVDLRQYPSLDAHVQEDIADKYRALHRRVIAAGLYECRYMEYGKELMRYTALFLSFLIALRAGWYLVSAVFLGLFWVGLLLCVFSRRYHVANTHALAPNYVHGT